MSRQMSKEPLMNFVNEAGWDRIVRVVLGVTLLYLGWSGVVAGTLAAVFKIVGFVPLVTGLVGWCPLYALFKVRTNGKSREAVRAA
jgi:hypothetical protein